MKRSIGRLSEKNSKVMAEQLSLMSFDQKSVSAQTELTVKNEELPEKNINETSSSKKLAILIDGSSFIYRAFFALPQLTNQRNESVGAVYGFCSMLLSILDKHQSDLFCVVLDASRNTFRRKLYPEYKNNREETPPELKSQFPILLNACKAFGLPVVEQEGYEADDIIATYANKLAQDNYEVRIIASDKDLMQLITDDIYLFDPIKFKVIKQNEVFEKYSVYPHQMIMFQALTGDKTDNIPGIEGIGPKTAAKLINEFGTIENIYEKIEDVSPVRIKEKLKANREELSLSEKLVTLCKEVPVDTDFSKLKIQLDINKAKEFLNNHNFSSLVKRLDRLNQRKEKKQRKYIYIKTQSELKAFFELNHPKKISIFTTSCFNGSYTLSICTKLQVGICTFLMSDEQKLCRNTLDIQNITETLNLYLQDKSIIKIGMRQILKVFSGIESFHDIMSLSYLLYGVGGDKLSSLFRDAKDSYICKFSLAEICNSEQAGLVAELFFDEFDNMYAELSKSRLSEVYREIDLPLLPILNRMEQNGIMVSSSKLNEVSDILTAKIKDIEKEVFGIVGHEFNIGSSKQLATVLFETLKIPKPKNKTSLDVESLEELYEYSPVPRLVVEWRKLSKLVSTYTDSLNKLRDPKTQRVYTTFHSTSTVTGRLSSSNPNLQNIPYRSEMGKQVRCAFISPDGYKLLSFDYSQIELRIFAHLADIEFLKKAFLSNIDVHKATASKIFKVEQNAVSDEMRMKAKTINFGIIYGMSAFRLSKNLGISLNEAKNYIENYFTHFPEFVSFKEKTINFARSHGYVETLFGRRCYIKDILSKNFVLKQFSERQALNAVVQGTAADIVKIAMIKIQSILEELHSNMLIQIHDELIFETPNEAVDIAVPMIKQLMENSVPLSVPLKVDTEIDTHL